MQVAILSGIYASAAPDFRAALPRNLVAVPVTNGISNGYLRPAQGIASRGNGTGTCRGTIVWDGVLYAMMGSSLVRIDGSGNASTLAAIQGEDLVTMDYSFDRLAITSADRLYYYKDGVLTQVKDTDLGDVKFVLWIDGYFMFTDGVSIGVTELNDPASINPLKYGSSEADPDPVMGLGKLHNEAYAFNRYTIEAFRNVGGAGFPFQRVDGAQVSRGSVGRRTFCHFAGSFAFVGSGRSGSGKEAPSVYLMTAGGTERLATSEIDRELSRYTEAQLAASLVEARTYNGHEHLMIHLPDQTLTYDAAASRVAGEPVWLRFTSSLVGNAQYRARHVTYAYNKWFAFDPQSSAIGEMVDDSSTHWGAPNGWEFAVPIIYNEGRSGVIHELELVALSGRVAAAADPVIWTSHSVDGETWSVERMTKAGRQGERVKRIAWRGQGRLQHWRIQRFRGTSDAHISMARLEAQIEGLAS